MLAIASLLVCGLVPEPASAISAAAPHRAAPGSHPGAITASGTPSNALPDALFDDPPEAAKSSGKSAGKKTADEADDKPKAGEKAAGKSESAGDDAVAADAPPPPVFIKAGKLYARPDRVLEGVGILVERGRVVAIGAELQAPKDVRKLEAAVVCAGFIDGWSSFALDPTAWGDERVSPSSSALDAVDPYVDPRWEREILRAGVTSYRLQAAAGARVGGLCALLRLHPTRATADSVLLGDSSVGLSLAVSRSGDVFERAAETERVLGAIAEGWGYLEEKNEYKHELAEWEKKIAEKRKELDDGFKKAKKDREKAEAEAKEKGGEFKEKEYKEDKKPKAPRYDEDKEVLARVANGELPLVVEAHSAVQIRSLLASADRFKRARLVLAGATEAAPFAKQLAEHRIAVLIAPTPLGFYRDSTSANASLALAAELEEAGVEVLLGSGGPSALASRDLPLLAALAIGHGMSPQAALAALTTRPARVFDVSSRVGSVELGRDADLLLLDGEPFAASTKVKYVLSGGDVVIEE